MNNFTNNENEDFSFHSKTQIPFEEDYEDIKTDKWKMFDKYLLQIEKTMSTLAYYKSADRDELIQDSYEIFLEFSNRYNPYYEGRNFMKFDRYLFRNLIMKIRASLQKKYKEIDREQPTEIQDFKHTDDRNEYKKTDDKLFVQYLFTYLTDQQKQIMELYMQGYKQAEIGKILNLTQSRISVVYKQSIKILKEVLVNDGIKQMSDIYK